MDCKAHYFNNTTRWAAPAITRIVYLQHHFETIRHLGHHFHPLSIQTEVYSVLSEVISAQDAGDRALVRCIDRIAPRLDVS
jgi:hypothetical protein